MSGQSFETLEALIWGPPDFVPKLTLCETARRSEDRLQDHPAGRDERHEETESVQSPSSVIQELAPS